MAKQRACIEATEGKDAPLDFKHVSQNIRLEKHSFFSSPEMRAERQLFNLHYATG
ncbi:MAG: hypothetical protein OEM01_08760 [Desulfobulbaceae bacterium]|nr:hypothetical protein [Desulfobulbaceae bacterium]